MNVQELIDRLSKYPPETPVVILDGFNGGGNPRTINFGPVQFDQLDWQSLDNSDCAEAVWSPVILGYGCY